MTYWKDVSINSIWHFQRLSYSQLVPHPTLSLFPSTPNWNIIEPLKISCSAGDHDCYSFYRRSPLLTFSLPVRPHGQHLTNRRALALTRVAYISNHILDPLWKSIGVSNFRFLSWCHGLTSTESYGWTHWRFNEMQILIPGFFSFGKPSEFYRVLTGLATRPFIIYLRGTSLIRVHPS